MQQDRGPDEALLQEGLPGRAMAYYNQLDKYGLILRYSPEHIGKLRVWWASDYRQINLELETSKVTLAPGKSFTIEYSFEPWDGNVNAPGAGTPR